MPYTQADGLAFWYDFDEQTNPGYGGGALGPVYGKINFPQLPSIWLAGFNAKNMTALAALATSQRSAFDQLATLQRTIFESHFQDDFSSYQAAFEDFGMGTLLDQHQDRIDAADQVHMMDTGPAPPVGFHRWHAFIRGLQTYNNDPWWNTLDQLVALAWAVQSTAQPTDGTVANPALPAATLIRLRAKWLAFTPAEIDAQYAQTGVQGYAVNP